MSQQMLVDIGNSRVKWAALLDRKPGPVTALSHDEAAWQAEAGKSLTSRCQWFVASVQPDTTARFQRWAEQRGEVVVLMVPSHELPLTMDVEVPERVGRDRVFAAIGAVRQTPPGQAAIIISAGTAITIDWVDETHTFRGGAILPGPWLMAKALHTHTAQLPLVNVKSFDDVDIPGRSTEAAMKLGILSAARGACAQLVQHYAKMCTQEPAVFLCGGAIENLKLDDRLLPFSVEIRPHLVLEGLSVVVSEEALRT